MPTSLLDTVFLVSLLVAALPVVTVAWTIDDLVSIKLSRPLCPPLVVVVVVVLALPD